MMDEVINYIDTMLKLLKRQRMVHHIQLEQDLITDEEHNLLEMNRRDKMCMLSEIREILVKREPLTK